MRTYRGWRLVSQVLTRTGELESERDHGTGVKVVVEMPTGQTFDLPLHLNIRNHSPTGFEWGYGGSGPAQLALALCCHALGEKIGSQPHVYQRFKFEYVAKWETEWSITSDDIANWYASRLEIGGSP